MDREHAGKRSQPLTQRTIEVSQAKRPKHFRSLDAGLVVTMASRPQQVMPEIDRYLPKVNATLASAPLSSSSLASALWKDGSAHAICGGDWEQLLQSCEVALGTAGDAFSQQRLMLVIGRHGQIIARRWIPHHADRRSTQSGTGCLFSEKWFSWLMCYFIS